MDIFILASFPCSSMILLATLSAYLQKADMRESLEGQFSTLRLLEYTGRSNRIRVHTIAHHDDNIFRVLPVYGSAECILYFVLSHSSPILFGWYEEEKGKTEEQTRGER